MDNISLIEKLEGKTNWRIWKFRVSVVLSCTDGAMDITEGKICMPTLQAGASDAEIEAHKLAVDKYKKVEATAMFVMTFTMTDDILNMVMQYETAHEIWQELHLLFEGPPADRPFNMCMQFLSYKRDPNDDIAMHIVKVNNAWYDFNSELTNELPELLLICKIIDTLDVRYDNFRSSWLLLDEKERTLENLKSHLCTYELLLKDGAGSSQEGLKKRVVPAKTASDKNMRCNYCAKIGHRVRNCRKWMNDGRPPKAGSSSSYLAF